MGSYRRNVLGLAAMAVMCAAALGTQADAAGLPSARNAAAIAAHLWTARESARDALKPGQLTHSETGAALRQDRAYIEGVLCRCELKTASHPAQVVVATLPRASDGRSFFAQVQVFDATASLSRRWYVVAVSRDAHGAWKLASVLDGGTSTGPPLSELETGSVPATRVSAPTSTRIRHLAASSVAFASAHQPAISHTSYGATIHSRWTLEARDGVYGLALKSGRILSCFTLHLVDTYTAEGGLSQDAARRQWGHQLAPGVYRSITSDTAQSVCRTGTGVESTSGAGAFTGDSRIVAVTGRRR